MSSTFRRNAFENPYETARRAANVILVMQVCPELEAKLSLLQPLIIPKRRRSTTLTETPHKIKRRRHSCAATGNLVYETKIEIS